jgi:hypothetical protein
MAFCNSCGAQLTEGTRFCNKCGAAVAGAPMPATPTTPASAPPTTGAPSSALKTVLIIVGVIVVLGILAIASLTFIGIHLARRTHVTQDGDHVKVETPFGKVETSKDPDQAAKEIGVEIYPGAEVQKEGASSASFGGIHTVTASFESSDSVDKVCNFYKSQFPRANVSTSGQNRCTLVSNNPPNMVTVNVESNGDASRFQITSVRKRSNE